MSTNNMNKQTLWQLPKAELIQMLLKQNSKIKKLMRKQKPTTAPRKSVKQMVQDYENNIINSTPKIGDEPILDPRKSVDQIIKDEPILDPKNVKQIVEDYEKNTEQAKQTADVLIFQRYDNKKDIPEGRKIAFKDHNGKPYILRLRRYFIINKISELYTKKIH